MRAIWKYAAIPPLLAISLAAHGASVDTDRGRALQSGATPLSAEEIARLLVGHTVTAKAGEKTFRFYYGAQNDLAGTLVGGNWSDSGFYGISDWDQVCLSISKDQGRLRCVTLLRKDGVVRKYDAAGNMTFEILEVEEGNRL